MNKAEKLRQLLAIKQSRTKRKQLEVQMARRAARLDANRLRDAMEAIAKREKQSQTYAATRFAELKDGPLEDHFFSTLSLGVYRMRREIASMKLQRRRIEGDFKRARDELNKAMAEHIKLQRTEEYISELLDEEEKHQRKRTEAKAEQALTEILRVVS